MPWSRTLMCASGLAWLTITYLGTRLPVFGSFAVRTHWSASYFVGLNARANRSYSGIGTFDEFMIHSPMPPIRSP